MAAELARKRVELGQKSAAVDWIRERQGNVLVQQYGDMYDKDILHAYGYSIALIDDLDQIRQEQEVIQRCLAEVGHGPKNSSLGTGA